jgi:alkanesulfonate monooxygenase SsuD/methylene tetrahydromethanopterin reductase-like flavin-dependent oxidoreductase (luciferase family)
MEFGCLLVTQYDGSRSMVGIGDELVEQTELLAANGFDSISVGEHHATADDQYLLNESVLAHIAEHVGDMMLSATLVLLPYHNPVRIAELGATLDSFTNGQFRLGVGLGYRPEEYDIFGVSRRDAPGRLVEGLDIIKRLWTEDAVTYTGRHFQIEDVTIRPKPIQDPRPPIWVGASNESSIRRGARIADGFLGAHVPFDVASEQVEIFRDERANEGKSPGEVGFLREAFVAPTTEAAEAAVRDPLMDKYESYSDWGQDRVIAGDDFDSLWDQLRQQRFLMGDPDDVAADVERYQRELDLDHVFVRTQFPNTDPEDVQESIRLFGERVIPRFN